MVKEVYEIWDFKGNEIKGLNIESLSQPPQNATTSRIYFDTTLQQVGVLLKIDNVDVWKYFPGGSLYQFATKGDFPEIGDEGNLYYDKQFNKLYVYITDDINDYLCINPDLYSTFEIKGQLDSLHNLGLLQGNIEDLGLYWHKIVCDLSHIDDYQAVYQATYLGNGIVIAGSYGGNGYGLKIFRS